MPKNLYQNFPQTPGVYIMKNAKGEILYIGKAVNLKRRVSSYFQRAHDYRIEKLVSQIKKIDYQKTDTGLEALILESNLIKKHQPPFNVLEKDDRSFLYVEITKEKFPRVLLVRGKDLSLNKRSNRTIRQSAEIEQFAPRSANIYGPFISASAIRGAIKIIRRIFPYSTHLNSDPKNPKLTQISRNFNSIGSFGRDSDRSDRARKPCFDYQIGLCPGTCIGAINQNDYAQNIKNIKLFFAGKKKKILESLKKEMKIQSKNLEFEKAEKTKHQIFALKHIQDTAFISEDLILSPTTYNPKPNFRIEGYDISNISGASAVGSMVVFINGKPDKTSYRKFKIYSVKGPDDTGMIKEVLSRRLKHQEWPLPDLILIDGGAGQINAAKSALAEADLKIPVVGIVKGPKRNKNEFVGDFKLLHQIDDRQNSVVNKHFSISRKVLIQVRDEAHRFAISYHKKLRKKQMVS